MAEINLTQSDIDRFWGNVRVDPATGCYLWTGHRLKKGYGRMPVGGKMVGAHHISWTIHMGPIPQGLFVCHHCDTPACVRHLFIGTPADNMEDMRKKGRGRYVMAERNRAKRECKRGHPLTGGNVYYDRHGGRSCRACYTAAARTRYYTNPDAERARAKAYRDTHGEALRTARRTRRERRRTQCGSDLAL